MTTEKRTISTRQLAELLSVVANDSTGSKAAHRTALELIHQVPEAQSLWQELTCPRPGMPKQIELAEMLLTLESDIIKYPQPGQKVVQWLAQQIPESAAAWDRLEQLVRVTGTTGAFRHVSAVKAYADYESLVRFESRWDDPHDLLDPTDELGLEFSHILNLLDFNIFRETDAAKREVLERVRYRIEKADSSRARPAFELKGPLAAETDTYPRTHNLGVLMSAMEDTDSDASSIYLAWWLIRKVPAAEEMWRFLHQPGEIDLTPLELTKLVLAARDAVTFPEAEPTVETLARHAPGAMEAWDELQRLRRNLGATNLYGDQIDEAYRTLDRLQKGDMPELSCWSVQAVMLLLHERLSTEEDPETRKQFEDVNARIQKAGPARRRAR